MRYIYKLLQSISITTILIRDELQNTFLFEAYGLKASKERESICYKAFLIIHTVSSGHEFAQ